VARESGLRAQLFQAALPSLSRKRNSLRRREHIGHHAAAQAANAEARWLFGGEDHQLDRAPRLEAKLLQHANRFQASEHAHASVIEPALGIASMCEPVPTGAKSRHRCPASAQMYCRSRLRGSL
jgi:hypothetical protein